MKTKLQSIAFLIMLICLLNLLHGCAQNETKESWTFPVTVKGEQVVVRYEFSVKQNLCLYYEQRKHSEYVTPLMSACVGDSISVPDANSIEDISPLIMMLKGI